MNWRKTTQPLMPLTTAQYQPPAAGSYDMYPYTKLGNGKICCGYGSLANWMKDHPVVLVDGYVGNDWEYIGASLEKELAAAGVKAHLVYTAAFLKPEEEIGLLVQPFIGEKGTVWGKRASITLRDLFDGEKLRNIQVVPEAVNIIIGVGAALTGLQAPVVYMDLPKNELQYRMRARAANNIGKQQWDDNQETYKRFYFVDWVLLNAHKQEILPAVALIADGQWKDQVTWARRGDISEGLQFISRNVFRVRPWFEAGAWGGHWMKQRISHLNKEEVNYAWSFEMIVPENGLVFESDGRLLEIAFDWLMMEHAAEVLGADAQRFGIEFPIRFDFLDTFDGGNLSIQCHPRLKYIQEQFGETITQDETYYILDCREDARVYLGFQEDNDPAAFREALEESAATGKPVDIDRYVQSHPAHKHDFFLIPNGTVHSSGKNNLVLEISATPYIFTFKMYDWVRLDLNGRPRPINIDHAFRNLDFSRKGKRVKEELISRQEVMEKGPDWRLLHLPTHPEHFYDVHRMEFAESMEVTTGGKCHVLMLVEGQSVIVETANGFRQRYNYAETFAIPAAAGSYRIINEGKEMAKVVKAFIK
ncbi:class I mannose-6-phosphate isomerase [Chitinophaga japonensis]|uniref:Mannose-6-phosphate isomerase class I n=1 Tax=Chitinophaga japonensis TaxID=104662 RepID=A0A562T1L9_CHIJA|nr:class I mannose-6-phosphate isomerase [Chitinophaga japonensis]TWI86816.1 mannose-6-phosphate isomerase class I [Chitinophaga japonensis]